MKKYFFLIILSIGIIGSTVSAETFGYGRTENIPINYSLIPTVNSSDYWDGINEPNATQFNNNDGTLSLDTSWLVSFGNTIWCKLTGCTMEGDIDMDGNDITNADEITANSFIGDGSGLTNLPGGADNDFHIFFNGSAYNNITYNLTDGDVDDIHTPVEPGRKFIFGEIFT